MFKSFCKSDSGLKQVHVSSGYSRVPPFKRERGQGLEHVSFIIPADPAESHFIATDHSKIQNDDLVCSFLFAAGNSYVDPISQMDLRSLGRGAVPVTWDWIARNGLEAHFIEAIRKETGSFVQKDTYEGSRVRIRPSRGECRRITTRTYGKIHAFRSVFEGEGTVGGTRVR
jgi:hypothetical protein